MTGAIILLTREAQVRQHSTEPLHTVYRHKRSTRPLSQHLARPSQGTPIVSTYTELHSNTKHWDSRFNNIIGTTGLKWLSV